VIVGGETDGRWLGGTDRQIRAIVLSLFVQQKLGTWVSTERKKDLDELHELLETGKVTPVIDRTFPLGGVPAAITYLREGARPARLSSRSEHGPRLRLPNALGWDEFAGRHSWGRTRCSDQFEQAVRLVQSMCVRLRVRRAVARLQSNEGIAAIDAPCPR
jgi:hypothetical protein